MRFVNQEEDHGCFIACVAMLLDTDYWTAKERLGLRRDAWPGLAVPDAVRRLRMALGSRVRVRHVRKFTNVKRRALAIVKWDPEFPEAHTVLWDGEHARVPWFPGWHERRPSVPFMARRTEVVIYV